MIYQYGVGKCRSSLLLLPSLSTARFFEGRQSLYQVDISLSSISCYKVSNVSVRINIPSVISEAEEFQRIERVARRVHGVSGNHAASYAFSVRTYV